MNRFYVIIVCSILCLSMLGCGVSSTGTLAGKPGAKFDQSLITTEELPDSLSVAEARQSAEDQASIHLVGRIGGAANPFVNGLAAFTMIDLNLPSCAGESECSEGSCCTPEELKANLAVIKFLNEAGKPISVDARELLNVAAKAKVSVRGIVRRDETGNMTVLADKLYLYPE